MPRTRRAGRKVQLRRLLRRYNFLPAADACLRLDSIGSIDNSALDYELTNFSQRETIPAPTATSTVEPVLVSILWRLIKIDLTSTEEPAEVPWKLTKIDFNILPGFLTLSLTTDPDIPQYRQKVYRRQRAVILQNYY